MPTTQNMLPSPARHLGRPRARMRERGDGATSRRSSSPGIVARQAGERVFNDEERVQLALVSLFQGFVNVDVLCAMGQPGAAWCLPEVRELRREAAIALLDRAVEAGLLRRQGEGYYSVAPAMPWYFRALFQEHYTRWYPGPISSDRTAAMHAFVEAMRELGLFYWRRFGEGHHDALAALKAEEANLLHARALARKLGEWRCVTGIMQGLGQLYEQEGRQSRWVELVNELVPDLTERATGEALPGREEEWSILTLYRVWIARDAQQWSEACRLQTALVDWCRGRVVAATSAPAALGAVDRRNALRALAVALESLSYIQCSLDRPEWAATREEAAGFMARANE